MRKPLESIMAARGAVLAALFALGWTLPAAAGQLRLDPQSKLWLEGDSTLHAYSSTATKIAASGKLESTGSLISLIQSNAVHDLDVAVEVMGLKSGKGGLDKNLYAALRAAEHPRIRFRMSGYAARPDPAAAGELLIKATGTLSVAGSVKEIQLEARTRSDARGVRITGSRELLMTDFGVKPPALMFGALKTDNRVVVYFDLLLDNESEAKEATRRTQP